MPQWHAGQPWFFCNRCRGAFLSLPLLPELVPLFDAIAQRAADWPRSGIGCPQCGRAMHLAHHDGIELDLCRHCHAVWLDRGEADRFAWRRVRQEIGEEIKAEAVGQTQGALSGADLSGIDPSGIDPSAALDWLGEALNAHLSSQMVRA